MSADAYGAGEADRLLGHAMRRGSIATAFCLIGAIGHDLLRRDGAKGFPRFTDPRLRSEGGSGAYIRMAAERSLERLGAERFDLLMLHNPDRTGYTNASVWEGMQALREAGPRACSGLLPGPANGFTLDLIDCFERFGELIDWAMIILSPMEPWPGELVLDAATTHDVKLITRVVDYGGLFHDDVRLGHEFAQYDHRKFRPACWVGGAGIDKLERMRPYAERHGLTLLQLACPVEPCAPGRPLRGARRLIQEAAASGGGGRGGGGSQLAPRPIEDKRAELRGGGSAARSTADGGSPSSAAEVAELQRRWARTPGAWP